MLNIYLIFLQGSTLPRCFYFLVRLPLSNFSVCLCIVSVCFCTVSGFLLRLLILIPFLLFRILSGAVYVFTAEDAIWEGKRKLKTNPRTQQLGTRKTPVLRYLHQEISLRSRSCAGLHGLRHSALPGPSHRAPGGVGQGWGVGDTGPGCWGHSGSAAIPCSKLFTAGPGSAAETMLDFHQDFNVTLARKWVLWEF